MKNLRNRFCPEGTDANAPLIYQRVVNQNKTMSRRTAEFQPSLRDRRIFFTNPADKSAGYFQISLQDMVPSMQRRNILRLYDIFYAVFDRAKYRKGNKIYI